MRRALKLAAAALALSSLTGCATKNLRATRDGGKSYESWTEEELHKTPKCDLRVCILDDLSGGFHDSLMKIYTDAWTPWFASLRVSRDMGAGRSCDVGIRMLNFYTGDSNEIISGYTGEVLATLDANFVRTSAIVCRLFAPSADLGRKLASWRSAARVASAPAPRAEYPQAVPAPPPPPAPLEADSPNYSSAERPDDLAVVIGVENYSDLPKAQYATNDAAAVKAHLRALGVPERNIVFLIDSRAGRSAIQKYVEEWLPRLTKPDSRVYFYFSGHGAPDVKTGAAYLMPWDGDANFLTSTAYPVKRLYEKLGELHVDQVLVAMDSCFSGAGGRSVLASGARPLVTNIVTGPVTGRVTALTASAATEISGSLDDKHHGAFTYFLLEGLNGSARDASGRVTAKSLYDYLSPRVADEARRLNRDQTPQLLGAEPDMVLR